MNFIETYIDDIWVRIYRISFSGELSYELAVNSNQAEELWNKLIKVGRKYKVQPYGTEALHILRAEKGFIVVGDETDGTVTPHDLGMEWIVSKKKKDFIGKKAFSLPYLNSSVRKQLVGILTLDKNKGSSRWMSCCRRWKSYWTRDFNLFLAHLEKINSTWINREW